MRRRYGFIAPFFLNYDFTFLALLLWEGEDSPTLVKGRCHANPLRKKQICNTSPALDVAADDSVILSYWKLQDAIADDGFWKALGSRGLALLLKKSYRKAVERQPLFDTCVQEQLTKLSQLEQEKSSSIDRTADTFAQILVGTVPQTVETAQRRALEQLLYHVGRWIYLVDARDDMESDKKEGQYNPILLRYGDGGDDESLGITLENSLNLARSAFYLGEFGCRGGIVENILHLGLPAIQRAVFRGTYRPQSGKKILTTDMEK